MYISFKSLQPSPEDEIWLSGSAQLGRRYGLELLMDAEVRQVTIYYCDIKSGVWHESCGTYKGVSLSWFSEHEIISA